MSRVYQRKKHKNVNEIFDLCVEALVTGAEIFNTTYKAINVWIFCIIGPILFASMIGVIIYQWGKIAQLKELIVK